jgi:hypothetical protein
MTNRGQVVTFVVATVAFLASFRFAPYGPVVWLAGVVAAWLVSSRRARQTQTIEADAVHRGAVDALIAQGVSALDQRQQSMTAARANLEAAERALPELRFDSLAPMLVNDLRGDVTDSRPTDDAVADAVAALALAERSRVVHDRCLASKQQNMVRVGATVLGMWRGKS